MDSQRGRVALIRHGQTEWSRTGRHTGVTDVDLTAHGRDQAGAIPDLLAGLGLHLHTVVVSPRQRARRTAELAGLAITDTWAELAEWDYGDLEGLTSPQIRADRPGWSIFTDGAPGGESPQQVSDRADRVLARAAELATHGDVALVCHGHFSRSLAVRWAGWPITAGAALLMDPAAITVLGIDRGTRVIEHANVIPFLSTWSAP